MSGLSGMKEICQYCGRSEATILRLIRDEGFPAVKIGGSWESDREEITTWRREKIRARKRPTGKRV